MATAESAELVVLEDGPIGRIELNRVEEGNSLTRQMMSRLADIVATLSAKPEIKVVALQARGPIFCRGRDARGEPENLSAYDMRQQIFQPVLGVYTAMAAAPIPIVALVHGNATGFGAAMAAACDITLAAKAARFSFPEIGHNIPPTLAMSTLIRKVPPKMLSFLIYSAQEISAEEAVACGLASTVYPDQTFAQDAQGFLVRLAGRPRLVLETIKAYQNRAADLSPAMASEYGGTLMAMTRTAQ
ncbi:MAG: enoyl-CoA hydratase/isomerase family protein [Xanthobacteraceae bacterium]